MGYNLKLQLEILNLFRRQESLDNLLEKTVCILRNLFRIYSIFAFHYEINMSSTNYAGKLCEQTDTATLLLSKNTSCITSQAISANKTKKRQPH